MQALRVQLRVPRGPEEDFSGPAGVMYSTRQPVTNGPGILQDQQVAAGSATADAIGLAATTKGIPKTAGRRLWKTLAGQFASALSSKNARQEGMPLQEKDAEQLDAPGTSKPQQQQPPSEQRALRPRGRDVASLDAERDMLINGVKSSVQKRRMESYRENAKTRVLSKRVPAEGTRILKKGTRELTSLLEGWEQHGTRGQDTPPSEDTPSGRKRRRAVVEASHKAERSLQDSGDLEEQLVAKRAAAAAATPAAAADPSEAAAAPLSAPQTATGRPRRAAAEDCLARTAALAMEYDNMDFSSGSAAPARQQQLQPPRQRVSSSGGGSGGREPPRTPHAGLPPIPPPTDPLNLPADVLELMASVFREPGDRYACPAAAAAAALHDYPPLHCFPLSLLPCAWSPPPKEGKVPCLAPKTRVNPSLSPHVSTQAMGLPPHPQDRDPGRAARGVPQAPEQRSPDQGSAPPPPPLPPSWGVLYKPFQSREGTAQVLMGLQKSIWSMRGSFGRVPLDSRPFACLAPPPPPLPPCRQV